MPTADSRNAVAYAVMLNANAILHLTHYNIQILPIIMQDVALFLCTHTN